MPSDRSEGGDPACWVHFVCEECGAVEHDGHRAGCPAKDQVDADVNDASGSD
ncbi:MAG TPA: hypothetical protein VGN59_00830 [Acidimicrobiia bacterium]